MKYKNIQFTEVEMSNKHINGNVPIKTDFHIRIQELFRSMLSLDILYHYEHKFKDHPNVWRKKPWTPLMGM